MRAAAFEKRIEKIIALDIFYQGLDALTIAMNPVLAFIFKTLVNFKCKTWIDVLLTHAMTRDLDLNWKIKRGYQLTGT